nr:immunoglobulin light chain junction region [Macaca mulatta]MOX89893.1 immunoglobulin light chain junction region [Macaca mulatta]MOX90171.1 immunoglobulin light chain junction region [Macaca mulatta]
CLQYSNDPFTF